VTPWSTFPKENQTQRQPFLASYRRNTLPKIRLLCFLCQRLDKQNKTTITTTKKPPKKKKKKRKTP
jgi:hypothetical protein